MPTVQYEEIKGRLMAGARFTRCTLTEAELVAETIRVTGCPVGGLSLLPMGYGEANHIPVQDVEGLVETDKLRYYVQTNGIWQNAALALSYLIPGNWGIQNLLDMVNWKPSTKG